MPPQPSVRDNPETLRAQEPGLLWRFLCVVIGAGLVVTGWALVMTAILSFIGLPVFIFGLAADAERGALARSDVGSGQMKGIEREPGPRQSRALELRKARSVADQRNHRALERLHDPDVHSGSGVQRGQDLSSLSKTPLLPPYAVAAAS